MLEPSKQASWPAGPTAGRQLADGRRVYRTPAPQVTWWVWAVVVLVSVADLAIQGHNLSALRFALGLLTVTGLVFACTLWPRVVASQDGMTVHNPFRAFRIPWAAVQEVKVADSVQVRCARTPPKKDKTVYSWALSSPRRANARAEMRARQWERNAGRNRPAGWDRLPESAKEIAKMSAADHVARELAATARQMRGDAGSQGEQPPATAGSEDAATAVVSARWAWQPLAALLVPGAAFAVAMLAG